jgi:hypothetical protein
MAILFGVLAVFIVQGISRATGVLLKEVQVVVATHVHIWQKDKHWKLQWGKPAKTSI